MSTQTTTTTTPAEAIQLQLLGFFEMITARGPTSVPLQAQRVLAYLAVTGAQSNRQELAGRLWPYTKQARAQGNLRTALWRIRQAAPMAIRTRQGSVALADEVGVDYRSLLDPSDDIDSGTASHQDDPRLVAILRHDLLPGWDEEWLIIERERTRQLRMRRLEELSRRYVETGRIANALRAAFAAIEIEPLRESAHLALIEAHMADGNRAEATRQVRKAVDQFVNELDIAPSSHFWAETVRLGLSET